MFAFTQIVKPITKYLKSRGFRVISYIDDFIEFIEGFQAAYNARLFLLVTLNKCGFLVNMAKLPPISQMPKALGLMVDTQKLMHFIPEPKIMDFLHKLGPILVQKTILKK